jgi:hypothetical protein
MKGRKLSTALLGALVGVILAGSQVVFATHTPADKVVATGDKMVVMGPSIPVTILTATLKTSKPTDLILNVNMECSIFTSLVTGGTGVMGSDTATATGEILAWVEIDDVIVPINSMSSPPQNPPLPGDPSDGVTFCNRTYSRTVTDTENNMPPDGQDMESDFIDTKSSNSFTWLRLNLGNLPAPHKIEVVATLTESATPDATAQAMIGNRSLIVEPAKLANDATI